MTPRLVRILTLPALVVVVMAFAVIPAQAQTAAPLLSAAIGQPEGQIKPDVEAKTFDVEFTYTIQNPNQLPLTTINGVAVVEVTWDCPTYISLTGPSVVGIPLGGGTPQDMTFDGSATYTVKITRNAPGLESINCDFTAKAGAVGQQTAVPESNTVSQKVPFTAGYFPLIQAKVSSKVKQAGPQKQIGFEIEMQNFGNAQTQILFALDGETSKGWKPVLPENLVLDSPTGTGEKTSDTVTLSIATPFKNGWNNAEQPFRLIMTPSATADNTQTGTPVTANVLARVRGVYVPAVEPLMMLGAVLGSALLLRLRKE